MTRSFFGRGWMAALCVLGLAGCGGDGSGATWADKCRASCDPSAVMACAAMDPSKCQRDCEALTSGLSATCATCVTQGNAWQLGLDTRVSGSASCSGYAFPSITDSSSMGCASSCK